MKTAGKRGKEMWQCYEVKSKTRRERRKEQVKVLGRDDKYQGQRTEEKPNRGGRRKRK